MNTRTWRHVAPVLVLAVLAAPRPARSQTADARTADPGILVSADWVAAHLSDPHVVVLHADTRQQRFDEAHIPGARFLDMNGLMWEGDPPLGAQMRTPAAIDSTLEAVGVSDGQRIVLYAANALMATRAWTTLDVMGLGDRASVLDGGLEAWKEDGHAVSAAEGENGGPASNGGNGVAKGSLTLHPRSGVVVDSDWILQHLDDSSVTILDARAHDQYTGDESSGGELHRGHIPGAYSLPWEDFVEGRTLPRMHSRADLAALVRASGAADGSTVAVYCVTGMRASFDYFVSRLLGYDVKFYDGSWRDWGSKDLPTVKGPSRR